MVYVFTFVRQEESLLSLPEVSGIAFAFESPGMTANQFIFAERGEGGELWTLSPRT